MHMKSSKKVILSIVAILVVAVGLITVLQWDNIEAIYVAKTHTREEIEEMFDKNAVIRKEAVSGLNVRELTDGEREAIKNGELNSSQALKRILETEENSSSLESVDDADGDDSSKGSLHERDYDAELAELIGKAYVLEASFSGSIDNLVSSAIAEYKALPAEQHTDANKFSIGLRYLGTAGSMESSCDQQMATILSQIESVLVVSGGDMKLLDEIKSAYANEKILKKDYYLSLYS